MEKSALILGCGHQMIEHLLPVLCCHDRIVPRWCYDLDQMKALNCAKVFSLQPLRELDASIAPDLIISAVRPTSSKDVILAGEKYSCPVFLEKPGCLSTAHLARLQELAASLGVEVSFGYNYRHSDLAHRCKDFVSDQNLISADYEFFSRHPLEVENGEKTLIESWLRGNAVHLMDYISFIHGDNIRFVSSDITTMASKFHITSHFASDDGCQIRISAGNTTQNFRFGSDVKTMSGQILTSQGFDSLTLSGDNETSTIFRASTFNKIRKKDGFYQQFSHMINAETPYDQFDIAFKAMDMVESILKSAGVLTEELEDVA